MFKGINLLVITMNDKEELLKCLGEKIELGKIAVEKLKNADNVEGVEKLVRKFLQEIRFLEKVRRFICVSLFEV